VPPLNGHDGQNIGRGRLEDFQRDTSIAAQIDDTWDLRPSHLPVAAFCQHNEAAAVEAAMSAGERAAFAKGFDAGRAEIERLRTEVERLSAVLTWIADRDPLLVAAAVAAAA
jgi:hypothetical protein